MIEQYTLLVSLIETINIMPQIRDLKVLEVNYINFTLIET